MGSLALRPDDSLAILTMASSIGFRNSVTFLSAIQATGLLTLTPVGFPPTEHASLCWTHPEPHKFLISFDISLIADFRPAVRTVLTGWLSFLSSEEICSRRPALIDPG